MRVSALPELQAYPPSFIPPPKAAMEARDFSRVSLHEAILERSTCAESFEPYPSTRDRKNPYYAIYVKNFVVYYVVLEHRIMEVRRFLYKRQNRQEMI